MAVSKMTALALALMLGLVVASKAQNEQEQAAIDAELERRGDEMKDNEAENMGDFHNHGWWLSVGSDGGCVHGRRPRSSTVATRDQTAESRCLLWP